ncbi:MAG: hypothetical protein ACYDHH_01825 [Solirubrobacteraceae bacterium]
MRARARLALALATLVVPLVAAAPAAAAPPVVGPVSAVEGIALPASTVIATFSDGGRAPLCLMAGNYTATVNWGDGSATAPATVTGPINPVITGPCNYSVSAGHTYAEALPAHDTITVKITGGGGPGQATGTATVSDAVLTAGASVGISATKGTPFSGTVATFGDGNTNAPAGDFTATISWGDGTSSSGTLTATGTAGQFSVSGTHTFSTGGALSTSVLVNDVDGASVTVPGSAVVAAAPTFGPASAVEGTALPASTTIATFSDGFDLTSCTAPGTYAATVNWGDGAATEPATVTANGTPAIGQPCNYAVTAGHTFAEGGKDTVTVTASGGGLSGVLSGSFDVPVSDAGLTAASSVTLQATGGMPFTGTVGAFTDANTGAPAGDFTATINWGDGTTSSGTVNPTGTAGQFSISGTHTYNGVGALNTSVLVTDSDGATVSVPGFATVTAPAAPKLSVVSTTPVSARAGATLTAMLGIFADADPGTTTASYKAAIAWGDGNVTLGTIVTRGAPGQFGVQGSHRYSAAGTFKIKMVVAAPLGRVVELDTTATIAPIPPTLALTVRSLALSPGPALSTSIACGSTDTSCRGYVSAYLTFHGQRRLGRSVFIIPGGKSATFVFPIPASARRHLRRATLSVSASGTDPSNGLSGRASKTIPG